MNEYYNTKIDQMDRAYEWGTYMGVVSATALVISALYTLNVNKALVTNEYWWLAMCICIATLLSGLIIMVVSVRKRRQYSAKRDEEFINNW